MSDLSWNNLNQCIQLIGYVVFFIWDLKRILGLRYKNHSHREIDRMLKVPRNIVLDIFNAVDAADVYWSTAYNLSSKVAFIVKWWLHERVCNAGWNCDTIDK